MSDLLVTPEELHHAAEEFAKASRDTEAMLDRIEKVTAVLEGKWGGITQQMFYRSYGEWRDHLGGLAALSRSISKEMHAIAERFEKADA